MLVITLAADLMVFALSEMNIKGIPLLVQNLLRLRMNIAVDISGTISKWTAHVTQHVYRHIHVFSLLVKP